MRMGFRFCKVFSLSFLVFRSEILKLPNKYSLQLIRAVSPENDKRKTINLISMPTSRILQGEFGPRISDPATRTRES